MTRREKIILEADDRASREIAQVEDRFSSFGDTVSRVSKFALAGGAVLAAKSAATALFDAGTAAQEAAAAFDTTFGASVDQASVFVEEFANKAGLATHEMEQQFAVLGNLVQGLGATEEESRLLGESMFRLAGDVASFSNVSGGAEPVLAALQSAINGETEALKTYGVALSAAEITQRALVDTGKTHEDQLTRLERANATVALAYEKANKAVGDLDRTQDSAANQARKLSAQWEDFIAQLGEQAVPILGSVVSALSNMMDGLGNVENRLIVGAARWDRWMATVESAAKQDYNRIFGVLDVAFGPLVNYAELSTDAAEATIDVANAIDFYVGAVSQGVTATDAFAIGIQEMMRRGTGLNKGIDQYTNGLRLSNEEIRAGLIAVRGYADSLNLTGGDISILDARIGQLTQAIIEQKTATNGTEAAIKTATGAIATSRAEADLWARQLTGRTSPALEEAAADTRTLGERVRDLTSAYIEAADPVFAAISAYQNYSEVLQRVDEDGERTSEELIELAEATLRAQGALSNIGAGNLVAGLDAIAASLGISRGEAADLARELGILDGTQVAVLIDVGYTSGTAGRIQDINRIVASGGGRVIGRSIMVQSGGFINAPLGQPIPAILHGQERVLTAAQNRVFDQLAAALIGGDFRGAGDTFNQQRLTVNVTMADGMVQTSTSTLLDQAALTTILDGVFP